MASYTPPLKNTQYIFYISLASRSQSDTFQANPTLASGDFKVAIDDGAPANPATLPVVDADFTKRVKVVLSAAEMNGDNITLIGSDAAGAEWKDVEINIHTATNQFDSLATQASVNTIDDFIDTEIAALPTAAQIADAVWDEPLTQPSGVFAWAGSFRNVLNWLGALSRNEIRQTATTGTLRNDANSSDLATHTISNDGTTTVRSEWS